MEPRFTRREDGQVDVHLGPDWSLFTEALNDSISSLPPRGASGVGPSTYWIEVARSGLRHSLGSGSRLPFTWGNITLLRLKNSRVEARYDFDEEDVPGQFVDVEDFHRILDRWQEQIQRSAAEASSALPETYRRNPSLNHPV